MLLVLRLQYTSRVIWHVWFTLLALHVVIPNTLQRGHEGTFEANTLCCLQRLHFNPFTAPACTISGLKSTQLHACKRCIWWSYNKSTLSTVHFDRNLSRDHAKEAKKHCWFQIWNLYWWFSEWRTAVKGLNNGCIHVVPCLCWAFSLELGVPSRPWVPVTWLKLILSCPVLRVEWIVESDQRPWRQRGGEPWTYVYMYVSGASYRHASK